MKKLAAISILLTFLTAAAFAQFKASVTAEFQADILRTAAPLDRASDTSKENPLYNRGFGYEKRYFNFLSSMDYWKSSELRLNLSYTDPDNKDDPKYGGLLQLKVDGLWNTLISKGRSHNVAGYDTGEIAQVVGTDLPYEPTLLDIVLAPFGDWNAWGRVGIFKGFVGNTDNRGATVDGRYAHYNNYMDKFKFENLGIMKLIASNPYTSMSPILGPGNGNIVQHNDVDISDLRTSFDSDSVYASVEANLAPITVALAGDLSGVATNLANQAAIDSHTGIGAAFRISGDVLDMLKFDVIYKITGGDSITDANQGGSNANPQPDGRGAWSNRFGIFGNVNLLNDTLGITAGYSGDFKVRENSQSVTNYVYPYYSGIDLRAHFSGMDKLKISFNNNFSFSTIKGSSDASTSIDGIRKGLTPGDGSFLALNHSDKSEGYFGMYNALLADFNMTEDLLLSFQVGNRLYVYNFTNKAGGADYTEDVTADELQLAAGAFYSLGTHVTLGTGLAFNIFHMTDLMKDRGYEIKSGYFTFGIPLTVKVVY